MKTETINGAIEELDLRIRNDEQQLLERKHAVNTLCEVVGQPARFNTHTGLRTVAPLVPTLADHEDENGKLHKEVKPPSHRRTVEGTLKQMKRDMEFALAGKLAKGASTKPPGGLRAKVLAFVLSAPAPVSCAAVAAHWQAKLPATDYHLKALIKAAAIRCTFVGRPSSPSLYWKPEAREEVKGARVAKPKAVAVKPPSQTSPPSQPSRELPALTAPLARAAGESDADLVKRVMARLPEPFTRADVDEFLPDDFAGTNLGLVLQMLRAAGEIEFASDRVGGQGPAQYKRGPQWKAVAL